MYRGTWVAGICTCPSHQPMGVSSERVGLYLCKQPGSINSNIYRVIKKSSSSWNNLEFQQPQEFQHTIPGHTSGQKKTHALQCSLQRYLQQTTTQMSVNRQMDKEDVVCVCVCVCVCVYTYAHTYTYWMYIHFSSHFSHSVMSDSL